MRPCVCPMGPTLHFTPTLLVPENGVGRNLLGKRWVVKDAPELVLCEVLRVKHHKAVHTVLLDPMVQTVKGHASHLVIKGRGEANVRRCCKQKLGKYAKDHKAVHAVLLNSMVETVQGHASHLGITGAPRGEGGGEEQMWRREGDRALGKYAKGEFGTTEPNEKYCSAQ